MCIVSFFFLSKRLPQISTRNDTPCPYTTLFRTSLARPGGGVAARPRLAARGGGGAQRADARRDGAGSARARRSELARDKVRGTLAGAETGARPPLSRRRHGGPGAHRSEEHTSELQSLMRLSYAVFCLKKKKSKEHYTLNN